MCGCRNLGEALRRIDEGASMIRTKGEAGTGNVVEAVRHARAVHREIKQLCAMDEDELFMFGASLALYTLLPSFALAAAPGVGNCTQPLASHLGSFSLTLTVCPFVVFHSQADRRLVRPGQEDQGDGPPPGR